MRNDATDDQRRTSPTPAERARTAVASARVGALTTYPRYARPLLTSVTVSEDAGRLVLCLPVDGPAARTLAARPLATLRIAPAGRDLTTLQGSVRCVRERPADRESTFVLEPGAVRLGSAWTEVVDTGDYWAAEPDPLREEAPGVLAHLRGEHGDALAACLRAQGHRAVHWVEAVGLDRYGLDLSVVDDEGVGRVRLAFPAPVRCVRELAPHLYLALRGGCPGCRERSRDDR